MYFRYISTFSFVAAGGTTALKEPAPVNNPSAGVRAPRDNAPVLGTPKLYIPRDYSYFVAYLGAPKKERRAHGRRSRPRSHHRVAGGRGGRPRRRDCPRIPVEDRPEAAPPLRVPRKRRRHRCERRRRRSVRGPFRRVRGDRGA